MRTICVFWFLLLASVAIAQIPQQLKLMPTPSSVQFGSGRLTINQSFSVVVSSHRDSILDRGVQRFVGELSHETGMRFEAMAAEESNATLVVRAEHGSEPVEKLGEDESYELSVSDSGAKLSASN